MSMIALSLLLKLLILKSLMPNVVLHLVTAVISSPRARETRRGGDAVGAGGVGSSLAWLRAGMVRDGDGGFSVLGGGGSSASGYPASEGTGHDDKTNLGAIMNSTS